MLRWLLKAGFKPLSHHHTPSLTLRLVHIGPKLKNRQKCFLPRLGLLNLSGLVPAPSGEWTASLPAGVSLDEASESAPSRSLHWSSYIRSDGMVSCFLSVITIILIVITTLHCVLGYRNAVTPWPCRIKRWWTHTHTVIFAGVGWQCDTFSLSFRSPCLWILWRKGCCQSSAALSVKKHKVRINVGMEPE